MSSKFDERAANLFPEPGVPADAGSPLRLFSVAIGPARLHSAFAIMNPAPSQVDDDQIDSRMPLWWAILSNVASFLLSLQFFWVPPDAWIRPMAWTMLVLFIGVATLPVLPLTLLNLKRLRGRTWPRYAVPLALTPIPLALSVAGLAHKIIGFHYSQ